ncbi:MAG: hypothetical protein R3250_08205 [Melioribacteraceae bacterium]|nr:hypothetical protein [Melioribacteraceae bacterium]
MKKKIFVILFLSFLVVNFYTTTSLEALDTIPKITNVQLQNPGI